MVLTYQLFVPCVQPGNDLLAPVIHPSGTKQHRHQKSSGSIRANLTPVRTLGRPGPMIPNEHESSGVSHVFGHSVVVPGNEPTGLQEGIGIAKSKIPPPHGVRDDGESRLAAVAGRKGIDGCV